MYDEDALAAVIVPTTEVDVSADILNDISDAAADLRDGGCLRVHVEGVSLTGTSQHWIWVDDYVLLSERGIHLPGHEPRAGGVSRAIATVPPAAWPFEEPD